MIVLLCSEDHDQAAQEQSVESAESLPTECHMSSAGLRRPRPEGSRALHAHLFPLTYLLVAFGRRWGDSFMMTPSFVRVRRDTFRSTIDYRPPNSGRPVKLTVMRSSPAVDEEVWAVLWILILVHSALSPFRIHLASGVCASGINTVVMFYPSRQPQVAPSFEDRSVHELCRLIHCGSHADHFNSEI